MSIRYIPEEVSAKLISHELAARAVSAALIAAVEPRSTSFPVVLGHGSDVLNRFSLKSAATGQLAGLKIGSYWRHNATAGLPCHNSCILLFDQKVGRIDTVIEASEANAYRTAAANALAVAHLARRDASRLAVFGAGNQAFYECAAVMRMRRITQICIVNRNPERANQLASKLRTSEVDVAVVDAREACLQADIIITATASRTALFSPEMVAPGTHISCMGTDAAGKQELPRELLLSAALYCDYLDQSLVIGEFQYIAAVVRSGARSATNLGDVLSGKHPGRTDDATVTVFDSSGLALQDLFTAAYLLEEAQRQGLVSTL